MDSHSVFVNGSTGYVGRSLILALVARGHSVRALARAASANRIPAGAETIVGDALVPASFVDSIAPANTLIHLIGTPHPSPAKAASFEAVDLKSVHAAVAAALTAKIRHFIYVSVAQPAPVMRAYVAARQAGEQLIRASNIPATIVRPWYVLGPGHRWPYVLLPLYGALTLLPPTREAARRLGLVTLPQMVGALVACVEQPPEKIRTLDVPAIRAASAAVRSPEH
jgi:uncharacterized protein YbjT (DUF2867 family)